MNKRLLAALLSLCFVNLMGCSETTRADSFYVGGIQVNEPNNQTWIQNLKAAEMNTVAVTVYAYQGDWDSDNLWFDVENTGVVEEIRAAKAGGLRVVLILRVALDHAFDRNTFLWHGLIMPRTDEQLASWFEKYTKFVTQWAKIAEAEGVDVLGIGSELNSLTSTQPIAAMPNLERYYLDNEEQQTRIQELLENQSQIPADQLWTWGDRHFDTLETFLQSELKAWQTWAKQISWQDSPDPIAKINQRRHLLEHNWRKLIRQTKRIYTGNVTYAANFDQYQQVGFWDVLDYVGVNAYFSLREDFEAELKEEDLATTLEAGWLTVLNEIEAFRQTELITDKPVIFTELGYTRWQNSTVEPWAYSGFSLVDSDTDDRVVVWQKQPLNPKERAIAIQALYNTLQANYPNLLKGILYWKLSTQPAHTAIEPFVLVLNNSDSLQEALTQFIK